MSTAPFAHAFEKREALEVRYGGTLRPLGDRIFVCEPPIKEHYKGLWIPPEAEWMQKQLQGEVIAVGPLVSPLIQPGLRVIGTRFGKVHLDEDGEVWVTTEEHLLCTIDWDDETD